MSFVLREVTLSQDTLDASPRWLKLEPTVQRLRHSWVITKPSPLLMAVPELSKLYGIPILHIKASRGVSNVDEVQVEVSTLRTCRRNGKGLSAVSLQLQDEQIYRRFRKGHG
jgi:hypothetical protein